MYQKYHIFISQERLNYVIVTKYQKSSWFNITKLYFSYPCYSPTQVGGEFGSIHLPYAI